MRKHKAYVDHPCCITLFEVIQDRGFIEVGHHGHVLNLVILGRIHGVDIVRLNDSFLKQMDNIEIKAETLYLMEILNHFLN